MWTSNYATSKCNMWNKSRTHVEPPSKTCVACTLQQHYETSETELWNKQFKYSGFYVSIHVRSTLLCNLCMVGMFGLYNTLTTLRTLNGTMFMLIILPKCASKWWFTMYGCRRTTRCWSTQWGLAWWQSSEPWWKIIMSTLCISSLWFASSLRKLVFTLHT
jgi:hypothetical protein